jgi:hypothetical protein
MIYGMLVIMGIAAVTLLILVYMRRLARKHRCAMRRIALAECVAAASERFMRAVEMADETPCSSPSAHEDPDYHQAQHWLTETGKELAEVLVRWNDH